VSIIRSGRVVSQALLLLDAQGLGFPEMIENDNSRRSRVLNHGSSPDDPQKKRIQN
jgi:hypothetical protein